MGSTNKENKKFKMVMLVCNAVFTLAFLFILGSCTKDFNNAGGGTDANQKGVYIFFFNLFLIFPCLFAAYVYVQVKLEKFLLSKEDIAVENDAFQNTVQETLKSDTGLLSKGVGLFAKNDDKMDAIVDKGDTEPEVLASTSSGDLSNTLIVFCAILCVIFILAFLSPNTLVAMTMAQVYNVPYGLSVILVLYKLGQFLYRRHKGIKDYEDKVSVQAAVIVFVMFFAGKMISGVFG